MKKEEKQALAALIQNAKLSADFLNSNFVGEIEYLIPFCKLEISRGDHFLVDCKSCSGPDNNYYKDNEDGFQFIREYCPSCEGIGFSTDEADDSESLIFNACHDQLEKKIKELKIQGVDIKRAGSIVPTGQEDKLWPVKLVVLARRDDFSNLEKLCELLESLDAEVNNFVGTNALDT